MNENPYMERKWKTWRECSWASYCLTTAGPRWQLKIKSQVSRNFMLVLHEVFS